MKIESHQVNDGYVTINYSGHITKEPRKLYHIKWVQSEGEAFELKVNKGEDVDLIYQEFNDKVVWKMVKGSYTVRLKTIEFDMSAIRQRNLRGVDIKKYKTIKK